MVFALSNKWDVLSKSRGVCGDVCNGTLRLHCALDGSAGGGHSRGVVGYDVDARREPGRPRHASMS